MLLFQAFDKQLKTLEDVSVPQYDKEYEEELKI